MGRPRDQGVATRPAGRGPRLSARGEDRVQGAVDHERRRPEPREAVEVAAAPDGPERGRPPVRPEPARDDGVRDARRVADPVEPPVEELERAAGRVAQQPCDGADRGRERPGRLRGAARQHQAGDALGMAVGGVDRDVAPERVAHHHGAAVGGLGGDRVGDHARSRLAGERLVRQRPVARQVHGDAPVAAGQQPQLRRPLPARQSGRVDEHDGLPAGGAHRGPGPGRGHAVRPPGARWPTARPGCGSRGRACPGCWTRGSGRCAR